MPGATEVKKRLQELQPSEHWLKFDRVDCVLGWPERTIARFVESIQPQECGSTRRRTPVSEARRQLEGDGIYFKPGYVAVRQPGSSQPVWGAHRLIEIGEPVLRTVGEGAERETGDGQVGGRGRKSAGDASSSRAEEGAGVSDAPDGTSDTSVNTAKDTGCTPDGDHAVEQPWEGDGASEHGSDVEGVADVRNVMERMAPPTAGGPVAWR